MDFGWRQVDGHQATVPTCGARACHRSDLILRSKVLNGVADRRSRLRPPLAWERHQKMSSNLSKGFHFFLSSYSSRIRAGPTSRTLSRILWKVSARRDSARGRSPGARDENRVAVTQVVGAPQLAQRLADVPAHLDLDYIRREASPTLRYVTSSRSRAPTTGKNIVARVHLYRPEPPYALE